MTPAPTRNQAWSVVLVGDLIKEAKTGFASGERDGEGVLQVRMHNVDTDGNLDFSKPTRVPCTPRQLADLSLEPGDVLFNNTNSTDLVGKSAVFRGHDEPVVFSNHFTRFRVDTKRLEPRYFARWLTRQQRLGVFQGICTRWVNQSAVRAEAVFKLEIPLPPAADEQRRIADILDKADAIRRKRRASKEVLSDLLRSSYLDLIGDPRRNPKGWNLALLGKLCSVERGKFTPRPRNDPRFYGGTYPFIQTGDISSSGGILTKWKQTLNEEGIAVSRCFCPGTVVIAIVGATIGETAILAKEMYCPDSVIGITPHEDEATPEYIEFTLRFYKQHFRDMAPETARANINLETLRPLQIPIPPLSVQRRFSDVFQKCYGMAKRMSDPCDETEKLFDALVQRAFQGEL